MKENLCVKYDLIKGDIAGRAAKLKHVMMLLL
jgi:hypothetical protein